GPIIISQACEFDYSGTQACKALREEGYKIVLVNSNPATIMTDPETADRTYIEPITPEVVAKIVEAERPEACLPTLGGQTGLNTAVAVAEMGVFDKYNVELIGATPEVIRKAEDRDLFRQAMAACGLQVPRSIIVTDLSQVEAAAEEVGFPVIIRPAFTLGGTGGGVAYHLDFLKQQVAEGLKASMVGQVMLEESVLGWKEYELEVMRDGRDNVVIVCSIENFDPMGVHTGDSITVAPAQTLTDKEYQAMRDAALKIIREIGVETGGSNIQFAINPADGEMVVIEMNPRVSRSSALASKATGFPIAKIAAKLAVGYNLDEIPNDITKKTLACFEPTIDYCVVKIPRWTFEKFPGTKDFLTTSMRSVGEVMSIGRTFKESLQKGIRSLEIGRFGFGADGVDTTGEMTQSELKAKLGSPNSERIFYLHRALLEGMSVAEIHRLTWIDSWFLAQLEQLVELEKEIRRSSPKLDQAQLARAKEWGFSDHQLAHLTGQGVEAFRRGRLEAGLRPAYKLVDTCAAEFEAHTPYYYSTYDEEDETRASDKRKVMILGSGPNRIGQGIEFDYCCCHASFALKEMGVESIMVNSNPETVSTDYDTSDKLYFEPLTLEDVLNIIEAEAPEGVIVQFGGQTPLNLTVPLAKAGAPILGTPPDAIDRAEDRKRFQELLNKLGLHQPENGTATTAEGALAVAERIGYPVVVRPSYVLGGRAMEIVYDDEDLVRYMTSAVSASPEHPVLIDKFLKRAIEIDVDAVADGTDCLIAGIMEHIEEAGIHSGDSACVLPPISLTPALVEEIKEATRALAKELGIIGLMNIQYAYRKPTLYVLEVNPRASRTVPFVSKATGVPWTKVATRAMLGQSLAEQGVREVDPDHISVKEAVFPFVRFPGVDVLLGPEMKSTGEVMGIDDSFGLAYAKAQLGAGQNLPLGGGVFVSVRDEDKADIVALADRLAKLGLTLFATEGTAARLKKSGLVVMSVSKLSEHRPHIIDRMTNKEIALIFNTTLDKEATADATRMRRAALRLGIPYVTTLAGARATVEA
ncbi:MAG: carbamoyl-phosphate synthase large subunit, partial [Deltaproteobacteria bacterium]|nr:carbamoyl-phosphate synthase large subunit [Deltaproteobacteria bacterium]